MQKPDHVGVGNLDLRSLRFLAAVIARRSVTRAGESMGLSQPAASRLLAQLRRALGGDPLLVRAAGGGYVPTARAVELEPKLAAAIGAADRLFRPDAFDPAASTRTFRVVTTDYGAHVVLAGLAGELARSAPGVSLDIAFWGPSTLDDLEHGLIDFALYIDLPMPAPFRHRDLFEESYACLVRRAHPVLRHRGRDGRVPIARLAELPRVLTLYPHGTEIACDDPLAAFGTPRAAGVFRTPYLLAGPLLVGSSDHALCTTRRLAELIAGMVDVEIIDFPEAGSFTYRVIWHDRADADPGVQWMIGVLSRQWGDAGTACPEAAGRQSTDSAALMMTSATACGLTI